MSHYQLAMVSSQKPRRLQTFLDHFARHNLVFDAVYRDLRGSDFRLQDYSQIIKDFNIHPELVASKVLVAVAHHGVL